MDFHGSDRDHSHRPDLPTRANDGFHGLAAASCRWPPGSWWQDVRGSYDTTSQWFRQHDRDDGRTGWSIWGDPLFGRYPQPVKLGVRSRAEAGPFCCRQAASKIGRIRIFPRILQRAMALCRRAGGCRGNG
jgi:hypothetical protein